MSDRLADEVVPLAGTGYEIAPVPLSSRRVPHAIRAFQFRDFRFFWIGAIVSHVGSHMQIAALAWVVARSTGSAFRTTLIAFGGMIPLLVMSPLGGAVADRFPRRRVLLVTQSILIGQAFLLFALWQAGLGSYWVLFGMAAATGVVGALNAPAWQAFVPSLVPRDALQNAVMLNSTQFNLAKALGPMAAGFVLAHVGAGLCFLGNALSYGAVLGALLLMSTRDGRRSGGPAVTRYGRGFIDAVRYVRSERGIMTGIITYAAMAVLCSPIVSGGLISILALKAYRVGPAAYGLLGGALGLGAITGAVILGRNDVRVPPSRIAAAGILANAGALAALAIAPNLAVGVVALVGVGASFLMVVSSTSGSIQMMCDDRMRGRVMALWLATFGAVFPVSAIVQGALADLLGIRTVVLADALLIAFFGILMASRGLLRSLDVREARRAEGSFDIAIETAG